VYLSHVAVQGFRNLGSFSLELFPGLNVLVGENNIGKTNLMDAVRAALGAASAANGEPVRLRPDDLATSESGGLVDGTIRIDLTFSGLSEDERGEFIELLDYNAAAPESSTASIHFEWRWGATQQRWHSRRWGGNRPDAETTVPEENLQSLPITFLEALRNALSALGPGRNSRLGRLLMMQAPGEAERGPVEQIVQEANERLEQSALILQAQNRIQEVLRRASGPVLGQEIAIRAAEPRFERIARGLRILFAERQHGTAGRLSELTDLERNGLGYNNLLYVGTVLAELGNLPNAALPLLLVEEPEAHLHPQLQTLLADCLAGGLPAGSEQRCVQTVVTTHSPTIAAHVSPETITILHRDETGQLHATGLRKCGLDTKEMRKLRRMLDVTRASMLFARGIILVEGISEALLLPVLARRLGRNLAACGVSVIPVCGVDFRTFGKLFGPEKLQLPLSIITDGDPDIVGGSTEARPRQHPDGIRYVEGERAAGLRDTFSKHPVARVFTASVTLEFDLTRAALENAPVMVDAWLRCYQRPRMSLLQQESIANITTAEERALVVWRHLCLSEGGRRKADFAHALAALLDEEPGRPFTVPDYLRDAIDHACRRSA
jgi:putative ATP-dependent endonuclease of OLD family